MFMANSSQKKSLHIEKQAINGVSFKNLHVSNAAYLKNEIAPFEMKSNSPANKSQVKGFEGSMNNSSANVNISSKDMPIL